MNEMGKDKQMAVAIAMGLSADAAEKLTACPNGAAAREIFAYLRETGSDKLSAVRTTRSVLTYVVEDYPDDGLYSTQLFEDKFFLLMRTEFARRRGCLPVQIVAAYVPPFDCGFDESDVVGLAEKHRAAGVYVRRCVREIWNEVMNVATFQSTAATLGADRSDTLCYLDNLFALSYETQLLIPPSLLFLTRNFVRSSFAVSAGARQELAECSARDRRLACEIGKAIRLAGFVHQTCEMAAALQG